jgi:uncharacterized FlgJ-related protein
MESDKMKSIKEKKKGFFEIMLDIINDWNRKIKEFQMRAIEKRYK